MEMSERSVFRQDRHDGYVCCPYGKHFDLYFALAGYRGDSVLSMYVVFCVRLNEEID